MDNRISTILEHWFLERDDAIFQALASHEIKENSAMACPVRCGRGCVEINPGLVADMSDRELDSALKVEAIRILLKHPYERRPDGCCQQAMAVGSNLVVGDNYRMPGVKTERPTDYGLDKNMSFEWYSHRIQEMLPPGAGQGNGLGSNEAGLSAAQQRLASGSSGNTDLSELWEEDDMRLCQINGIIESCQNWGSLAGEFAERIKASTRARINWRNVFSGFRASIVSSRRQLTRMRPNRRTGFENMGSIRRFDTKLLVAVDVSGSIGTQALSDFYGVINSAFKYGFEHIDVIQFDSGIRVVQSLDRVIRETVTVGRGGTSFQEPVDYAHENGYDGLVMLTDGYAPRPELPDNMRCKLLWVCCDKSSYEHHNGWMSKLGRVCTMELK